MASTASAPVREFGDLSIIHGFINDSVDGAGIRLHAVCGCIPRVQRFWSVARCLSVVEGKEPDDYIRLNDDDSVLELLQKVRDFPVTRIVRGLLCT